MDIILAKGTVQFDYLFAGWHNELGGFRFVGGSDLPKNPTKTHVAINTGQRYVVTFQIRNGEIKALLDGKLLTQYKTDFLDLSISAWLKLPSKVTLGVSTWQSVYVFHAIELIEVTGHGKPLR